jgi:hypothetical protein
MFHELYLQVQGGGLVPIPILVENSLDTVSGADSADDVESWSLTRRFFLVDNKIGGCSLSNNCTVHFDWFEAAPRVLAQIENLNITMKFKI